MSVHPPVLINIALAVFAQDQDVPLRRDEAFVGMFEEPLLGREEQAVRYQVRLACDLCDVCQTGDSHVKSRVRLGAVPHTDHIAYRERTDPVVV